MQPGGVSPGTYILFDILVGSIVIKFVNIYFLQGVSKKPKMAVEDSCNRAC